MKFIIEAALKKMSKDELIALNLEYQPKFNITFGNITGLKCDFRRLELELSISRLVYSKLCDRVRSFEHQYWANNQYTS